MKNSWAYSSYSHIFEIYQSLKAFENKLRRFTLIRRELFRAYLNAMVLVEPEDTNERSTNSLRLFYESINPHRQRNSKSFGYPKTVCCMVGIRSKLRPKQSAKATQKPLYFYWFTLSHFINTWQGLFCLLFTTINRKLEQVKLARKTGRFCLYILQMSGKLFAFFVFLPCKWNSKECAFAKIKVLIKSWNKHLLITQSEKQFL